MRPSLNAASIACTFPSNNTRIEHPGARGRTNKVKDRYQIQLWFYCYLFSSRFTHQSRHTRRVCVPEQQDLAGEAQADAIFGLDVWVLASTSRRSAIGLMLSIEPCSAGRHNLSHSTNVEVFSELE
jgi:hypothetical protein